jgi:hypothetical protein
MAMAMALIIAPGLYTFIFQAHQVAGNDSCWLRSDYYVLTWNRTPTPTPIIQNSSNCPALQVLFQMAMAESVYLIEDIPA